MPPRHVYVHVPFCARRCSYCDFSIAVRRNVPVAEYLDALRIELAGATAGPVDTIYFGGGTPSLLRAEGVARLLQLVSSHYAPVADAEITLEANPEDVTRVAAAAWRAAGINRLSIGAQSFDARVLEWMHRNHSSDAAARAVHTARNAGIDNISLDLIFALPDELGRDWGRDLEMALRLEPDHLSVYGLTIEPATPLARWRERGLTSEAPEETYERDFLLAHDTLAAAGFHHYEVSNFARAGRESRHNQAYWTGVAYAGHGPAAHRYDGATRAWNESAYSRWLDALAARGEATAGTEMLSAEQLRTERVYLGLRTSVGLELDENERPMARGWQQAGWARLDSGRVTLEPLGWLRLDALTATLTGNGSHCNV